MKKRKNQILAIILSILSVFALLVGCTSGGSNSEGTSTGSTNSSSPTPAASSPASVTTYKIGMTLNDKSPFFVGAEEYQKRVKEKTQGKIDFEIYPSAVLGNDRDLIEGLSMGTVDMAVTGLSPTNSFVPETQIFSLPFLFDGREHVAKVLNGPVGDEVAGLFDNIGIKLMAYWENGFRHLSTSKYPVKSIDDLKGLKIRVMESPLHISIWSSLGTDPTPITWAELFTALQQGTVDGQENPISLFTSAKFYEVQKNISMTGHVYEPAAVMFSKASLGKVSEEMQKIIVDTAKEVAPWQIEYCTNSEAEFRKTCEENGVIFEDNPDIEAFRTAVAPVYNEFIGKYSWAKGYLDRIQNS